MQLECVNICVYEGGKWGCVWEKKGMRVYVCVDTDMMTLKKKWNLVVMYDEEHSQWEERTHLSWNEAIVKTSALWIYVKLASGVDSEEPSNLEGNQAIVIEAEERRERAFYKANYLK